MTNEQDLLHDVQVIEEEPKEEKKEAKKMGLFKKAKNESAYLKCGILGFQGSGKTHTASKIAIGLWKFLKADKPIFFIDTENGSDKIKKLCDKEEAPLYAFKSRVFIDLMQGVKEAEKNASILIIDSVTHFWEELCEAYRKKYNLPKLRPFHYIPIKQEWKPFRDLFMFSRVHIILCGRATWRFGQTEDEEGYKQTAAIESKMKVEGDMGYESELLLEMELTRELEGGKGKIGAPIVNRCWVLKDKWDEIQGQFFDKPDFNNFLPVIKNLNLKAEGVDISKTGKTSEELFNSPDKSMSERYKQRDILLEEIQSEMVLKFGRGDESKREKIKVLRDIFGTSSWTAIENKENEELRKGLIKIKQIKEEKANDKRVD